MKEVFEHKGDGATGEWRGSFMIGECKKHPLTKQCKHGWRGCVAVAEEQLNTFTTLH